MEKKKYNQHNNYDNVNLFLPWIFFVFSASVANNGPITLKNDVSFKWSLIIHNITALFLSHFAIFSYYHSLQWKNKRSKMKKFLWHYVSISNCFQSYLIDFIKKNMCIVLIDYDHTSSIHKRFMKLITTNNSCNMWSRCGLNIPWSLDYVLRNKSRKEKEE
jgi:hypothetical protein